MDEIISKVLFSSSGLRLQRHDLLPLEDNVQLLEFISSFWSFSVILINPQVKTDASHTQYSKGKTVSFSVKSNTKCK